MDPFTYISCFAGVGGLDIGLELAFPEARCIGRVEREIAASEIMAARIREGTLTDAPQWSDVRSFPSRLYRGRTRGVLAGFPCPDYSCAGKRAGIVGKHGQLWDDLAAIIRDVGPDVVLLENVSGILVPHDTDDEGWRLPAGLWFVLGDLASLGFDAEWMCVSAGDTGASQERLRWFCLAWRRGTNFRLALPDSQRFPKWGQFNGESIRSKLRAPRRDDGGRRNEDVALPALDGWRQGWTEPGRIEGRFDVTECRREMAYAGREHDERRRDADVAGTSGTTEDHSAERERSRNANGSICLALDESECAERWTDGIGGDGCNEGPDGIRQAADRAGESNGDLGVPECPRWAEARSGSVFHAGEEPESGSGSVEHTASARFGGRENGRTDCGDETEGSRSLKSERGSRTLGNSDVTRLEGRHVSGCGLPNEWAARARKYPLYPPGPGLGGAGVIDDIRKLYTRSTEEAWRRYQAELTNTYRWIEILDRWPELAPAIDEEEAESVVFQLGDELESVLGNDRTNALRAVGNGVAPLPAAVSFVCLARRAGLTFMAGKQTEDPAA